METKINLTATVSIHCVLHIFPHKGKCNPLIPTKILIMYY